ncbi:hypothetical protein EDB92DRAFT_1821428 [Lactarius akahatsu]|uniref:Uncharacterized protein n=1 Tax=Lactarius akahatsu TaxID=416441 RepID=A0AAD4Q7M3_9AGAM|nr:hypothetical protein EDB92DRAFT_1821428 [Lactarius akahatsu]
MSPCHSHRSSTGSPSLPLLTSAFLDTLSLDDEFPRVSGLFRPFSVSPVLPDDEHTDDDDIWYDAEEGDDTLWPTTARSPPSVPLIDVGDDTHLRRGVKTSTASVSPPSAAAASLPTSSILSPTPRYPPLFPHHAFERPKDPDRVEPATHSSHKREAIVPPEHPLYTHIHKKKGSPSSDNERPAKQPRPSGTDADDERKHKRLRPQLARRTHPLPRFVKYRLRPKTLRRKAEETQSNKTGPGPSDRTLPKLEEDELPFDFIRQHIAFCCRPGAKDTTYPINPFPTDSSSAVQGFRKRYRPIDMTKKS